MIKMKKLSRQVIFLGFVSLFTDMASEMLYPVTPLFLSSVLGASMAAIGLIEGLAEITAGLLKGYFGFLSDKLRQRSIFVILGYAVSALAKPLPGLIANTGTVLFSRVFDRVGKGIRTAPRDALLASYSNGNTGAVFGFHRAMDTIGAVVGPLLALLLLNIFSNNYQLIFLIAFIPSLAAVTFALFVKDSTENGSKANKNFSYSTFWKTAPKQYKILLLLVTIFSLVNSSDVFLILKSKDIAQSNTIAILGYVFYNFVYAVASYPAGIMADKLGKKNVFILGLFIFSFVYLGFAVFNSFAHVWILFALYGIYAASTEGILKAWVSDILPDESRGSAIGLLTMMMSIAVMAGSFLAGVLWDSFGSSVPFYTSAAASLVVAVAMMLFTKNNLS